MGKLKVCHIITQLELGGAQRNTLYTVSHLNRERFEPLLIAGSGGILDDEARQAGVWLYFIASLVRPIHPAKDLYALVTLYRYLRHLKPQIVHTHSSKAGILGRIAAYFAGVPVIIHTFHGFGFTPDQRPAVRQQFIRAEKFCALLSTHLLFVSEENQKQAQELGIGRGKPWSLIRSGISFRPRMSSPVRQELHIPSDAWVVASVGNFKPQKNPMDLARVAAAVLKQDPSLHFIIAGDGELRPAVEKWVSEQPQAGHIHFLGWRQDIPEILAAANTFLLTSLWEGLPRALVEAFWANLPAVAYAVDGVRDILEEGKNGFPIPPGDIAAAAEKLLWLKNHPADAQILGAHGRARVHKEFDIDLMVRQQETLYEKLYAQVPLKEYYEPPGSGS